MSFIQNKAKNISKTTKRLASNNLYRKLDKSGFGLRSAHLVATQLTTSEDGQRKSDFTVLLQLF